MFIRSDTIRILCVTIVIAVSDPGMMGHRDAIAQTTASPATTTSNDDGWHIVPNTGDIDTVDVSHACPCPLGVQESLGLVRTPIEMRVRVAPQEVKIHWSRENCTSSPRTFKVDSSFQTTHEWGVQASAGATASTEVETGLLSSVVAEGKVGLEATAQAGGNYGESGVKVHGTEEDVTIPPCAGLIVATFYVDYYAEGRQYLVDHLCCRTIDFDSDGEAYETCEECFDVVIKASAQGDGDSFHVRREQEYHPCTFGCEGHKDPISLDEALSLLFAQYQAWPTLQAGWERVETRDFRDFVDPSQNGNGTQP